MADFGPTSVSVASNQAESGQSWPSSVQLVSISSQIRPSSGRTRFNWSKFGRTRPTFVEHRPRLAASAKSSPLLGRFRPQVLVGSRQVRQVWPEFGQSLTDFGQIWPISTNRGRWSSHCGRVRPNLCQFRQTRAEVDLMWTDVDQHIDPSPPISDRPDAGQIRLGARGGMCKQKWRSMTQQRALLMCDSWVWVCPRGQLKRISIGPR